MTKNISPVRVIWKHIKRSLLQQDEFDLKEMHKRSHISKVLTRFGLQKYQTYEDKEINCRKSDGCNIDTT